MFKTQNSKRVSDLFGIWNLGFACPPKHRRRRGISRSGRSTRLADSPRFAGGAEAGFTLVEIIIAIGIMVLLASVIVSGFLNFRKESLLNSSAELVVSSLLGARAKTLSSEGGYQYGVHLQNDRVVLFRGALYSAGDPNNVETVLPSAVEISAITLAGGGTDLVFARLTGATSQYGSMTVRVKSDVARTRAVSITATGIVSVQ